MRSKRLAAAFVVALLVPLTGTVAVQILSARASSTGLVTTLGAGGVIEVSDGSFDVFFDPAQEGGISRVYDLTSDPGRTVNVGPPAGYTLFDTYVNSNGWAEIGRGPAGVLEVTRSSAASVMIHAVGIFMHEDGSGAVVGLQHETWTTLYPGGRIYLRRQLITGAGAVALSNLGGKSLDVSPAPTMQAIFTGAPADNSYPSGTNGSLGDGSEGWLGFWQGGSGPGQSLGMGESSWQSLDFGFTYRTVRVLVGNASSRSHEAQRTEQSVTLAANTTYSGQFAGWLSPNVRIASMNSQLADYRSPGLTVSSGTLATSDTEPVAIPLSNGYNPATGSYVINSQSTGVGLQLQFPAGVATRYQPSFKVLGWPGGAPQVQLGSANLTAGVDYLSDVDGAGALRLTFLKDVVAASPSAGQLLSGPLTIAPSGAPVPSPSPSPSPGPSPSPSPSASPSPSPLPSPTPPPPPSSGLQTIVGANTIEVNDGSTFAAIFDRNQEGGISQLYDLTSDPGRTVNVGPPSGYSLFDTYIQDTGGWADVGRGPATVLEVTRASAGSVVVHSVGDFMHENGSGAVVGLRHETWTTLYPGGHVYIRRQLITGAGAVALTNFGGKSLDVSNASTWNAIFTGAAADSSYPAGTDASLGNGAESWLGFWESGSGPGLSEGVGMTSWQSPDFGFTYKTVRVLVGSAASRSHEAQRTEQGVTLAANTTYSGQFAGWISGQVRIASMNAQSLDYRSPALTVSNGAIATSDSEPTAIALTNGYNPATGSYVISSTSTGVGAQLQFPGAVATRYQPSFKLTGWPTNSVQVQLGGATLTLGVDYLAGFDSASGTLRVAFLKDFVGSSPQAGQLQNNALTFAPGGAPLPSPSPFAKSWASSDTGIAADDRRSQHHRGQRREHIRRHLRSRPGRGHLEAV